MYDTAEPHGWAFFLTRGTKLGKYGFVPQLVYEIHDLNSNIEFVGNISEIARYYGLKRSTLSARISRGISVDEVVRKTVR